MRTWINYVSAWNNFSYFENRVMMVKIALKKSPSEASGAHSEGEPFSTPYRPLVIYLYEQS